MERAGRPRDRDRNARSHASRAETPHGVSRPTAEALTAPARLLTLDRRAHRVAARIEAGLVSVNTFRPVHFMLPYGGYKMSGVGRENGFQAVREFTETKTVVVDLATEMPADPFGD